MKSDETICPSCSAQIAQESTSCSYCGNAVRIQSLPITPDREVKKGTRAIRIALVVGIGGLLVIVAWTIQWVANGGLYKDNTPPQSSVEQASTRQGDSPLATRPTPTPKASEEPGLTEEQAAELAKPSTPVEYQLAVMDAGHLIPKNDPTVKEFRKLLIALRKRTGYSFADLRQKNMVACMEVRKRTGLPVMLFGFMSVSFDLAKRYAKDDYNMILAGMITNGELFNRAYEQQQ